jgi:hypothetical protein
MNKFFKTFSLADINIIREESQSDDIDFAYAKLDFLSDGYNGQNCWMTEETLRKWANTVLGKFITAKYSQWENDVKSHERDLDIVGYVPTTAEITFKKLPDGRTMASTECVISKIYATNVYEMFLHNDAERSVSVEFSCAMGDDAVDGEGEIIGYSIHSVTILGKKINPAIKNANIQVFKFSAQEAEDVFVRLKNLYNKDREMFMSEKEENLERKENAMKKVNKEVVEEVIEEKQFSEEETKNNETVVEEKQNSEETCEAEDKELSDEESDVKTEETEDKEMSEEEVKEEESTEEDKEMSDEDDSKDDDADEDNDDKDEEDKEMSEGAEVICEDDKEMSLDAFADSGALLAMLENETADNIAYCQKLFETKDVNNIIMSCLALKKENDAYKAEKALAEQKECEMKFAECMASVKCDLTEQTYASLYEEGKAINSLDEFKTFSAKVKAFAYDESKIVNANKVEDTSDTILRMGMPINDKIEDDDVFNRIANK